MSVQTCSALGGGNPNLKPEKGDTFTVGTVLTPRFLPRFSLSVDYFNIKVKDYISSVPTSLAISQCFSTGDPYFCGLFHRDPRTGVLFGREGYVVSTNLNTGSLKTSGIDVVGSYSVPTESAGTFNLDLTGTWLNELVNEPLRASAPMTARACSARPAASLLRNGATRPVLPGLMPRRSAPCRSTGATSAPPSSAPTPTIRS